MNRGLLLVAGLALVVRPATSRADDEQARNEARDEYAAGQAAEQRHDFEGAIAHYEHANQLSPHAFNLFNIAVNYEHLGKLREAVDYYTRYLAALPEASDRPKVTRLIDDLRAHPGMLTVTTIPAGASVSIDGVRVGTSPYSHQTKGGRHEVVVEGSGNTARDHVDIEYGEPASVVLQLAGRSGAIAVSGNPFGAQISVDGQLMGLVPSRIELPPGTHAVEVTSYGYAPYSTSVEIVAGETFAVRALLDHSAEPLTGVLGPVLAPPKSQLGYVVGIGGGYDVNGPGALLYGELGYHVNSYTAVAQIGKSGPDTLVGVLVRWTKATGAIKPFVGFGIAYDIAPSSPGTGSGSGSGSAAGPQTEAAVEFELGVKAALIDSPHFELSALASVMARIYATSSDDDDGDESQSWSFPFLLTLEASTK